MKKSNFINIIASMLCILMLGNSQFGYAKVETNKVVTSARINFHAQHGHVYTEVYHLDILLSEVINEEEVDIIINSLKEHEKKGEAVCLVYKCDFADNADVKLFRELKKNGLFWWKINTLGLDEVFHNLSDAGIQAYSDYMS